MCGNCRYAFITGSMQLRWCCCCVTGYLIRQRTDSRVLRKRSLPLACGSGGFSSLLCFRVCLCLIFWRGYWGFVGNKYAKWNNFFRSRKGNGDCVDVIKTDVLQTKRRCTGRSRTGHNSLAGNYSISRFLAFVAQSIYRVRTVFQYEHFVAASDVCMDCAITGRGNGECAIGTT